jgi:mannosylglycoprotein endo-beta-mannosidase
VKWEVVCRDKKKGGLGVRDLEVVNLSLLLKWRWRLLNREDFGLWKDVLVAKYGIHIVNNVNLSLDPIPDFASLWWKDLCGIDEWGDSPNWLEEVVERRIGNGRLTRFWKDVWIGNTPLCVKFPRLFSLSLQKEVMVGDLLKVDEERRWWALTWRRHLFQWEEERVNLLLASLENVLLTVDEDDWEWSLNPGDGFSVKSAYDALVGIKDVVTLSDYELKIFSNIWESPAPSKVVAFSWKLLYDRLPTKDNLLRRGVLPFGSGENCVWCGFSPETSNHLFLHCSMAHKVWYDIFKWLGVVIVMPSNIFSLFDCVSGMARNAKLRKGFRLVWHTVVWSLWGARNDDIFNGVKKDY